MAQRIYVALDLETTGLDPKRDAIMEIGAVRFTDGVVLDRFATLVNPQRPIPLRIQQLTGIRDADVAHAPRLEDVLPELRAFVSSQTSAVIAHNAPFDMGFLRARGVNFQRPALDTLELATILLPGQASYSLGELCHRLQIPLVDAHRALDDAAAAGVLFERLVARIDKLPDDILFTIADYAQECDWAPRFLFADATARRTRPGGPGWRPRVELDKQPAPTSLITDESATVQPIAATLIARSFAADGPLAAAFGAGYEPRAGQVDMAQQVARALNQGDPLMVEAGTGTGKTLAYLIPAAAWALENQRRVVIATNTITLQDQLIEKDIPQAQAALEALGMARPRAAVLKGRSNYICLHRLQRWRSGRRLTATELSTLARILVWLPTTQTGDINELSMNAQSDRDIWPLICADAAACADGRCGVYADATRLCYFALARRKAEMAHLLVVNHALLLADVATEGRVLPPYSHLIVDEAHRLEDAATDQLTYRVEWPWLNALLRPLCADGSLLVDIARYAGLHGVPMAQRQALAVGALGGRAHAAVQSFHEHLLAFAVQHEEARDANYVQRLPLDGRMRSQPMWSEVEIDWEQAAEDLRELLMAMDTLARQLGAAQWDSQEPEATQLVDLTSAAARLGDLLRHMEQMIYAPDGSGQGGRVCWMEINENRSLAAVDAAPLNVGDIIQRELLHARRSTIFTGATLRSSANFRYIRERLGLWDVPTAIVESPFDYKQSTLLYMPSDMVQPDHPAYQTGIERAILDSAEACNGRTLVLFTSNAHLRTTGDALRVPMERAGITLLQQGAISRHRLLREYRSAERAVLLGTRSFWEGVDLPGDQLSCLLIVRLPFAVPNDPMVAARSRECENSFSDYMLPDAVLRFRQGFGRLIRRATDRGVVVILDSRVWRKEYGQVFLDALPPCTTRHAPLSILGDEVHKWLAR
jgi:predicted DnaQ family exonuclease/DinG family helicase